MSAIQSTCNPVCYSHTPIQEYKSQYKSQTSTHNISRICDKMSSTSGFGVQFFVRTKVNHQQTTTPKR
jgi:hypothetical protein